MAEFSELINDVVRFDPPLFGGSYALRRGENHRSASRIDTFLYSSERNYSYRSDRPSFLNLVMISPFDYT